MPNRIVSEIYGTEGADEIFAQGNYPTRIYAGSGNDTVYGDHFNDALHGDHGNDRLFGGFGNDRLFGGSGSDLLAGEWGNDTLTGGGGRDRFVAGEGHDVITDWQAGETIDFRDFGSVYRDGIDVGEDDAGNTLLTFGANSITLRDVTLADFDASSILAPVDDFGDDPTSAREISATGGRVRGTIDITTDHDWFHTTFEAGETYVIRVLGFDQTGHPRSLPDPYLMLLDENGAVLAEDDDRGYGLQPRITYTAAETGDFYLDVSAFDEAFTGKYVLAIDALPDV